MSNGDDIPDDNSGLYPQTYPTPKRTPHKAPDGSDISIIDELSPTLKTGITGNGRRVLIVGEGEGEVVLL